MTLYHLDRTNTFPSDKNEQLSFPVNTNNTISANNFFQTIYPHGISETGKRYLNTFDIQTATFEHSKQTCENFRIYTIEYIFEMIRLHHFSHLPSRFTSLFACETPQDIKSWYEILKGNAMDTSNATVKTIETHGTTFCADSQWRDKRLTLKQNGDIVQVFNPFAYHEWAYHYWNGKRTENPLIEVLCELPVTVTRSVPLPEFLDSFIH